MTEHQCELPWTGSIFQCPDCGKWYQVVKFYDDENGLTWKGWAPIEESDPNRSTQPNTS